MRSARSARLISADSPSPRGAATRSSWSRPNGRRSRARSTRAVRTRGSADHHPVSSRVVKVIRVFDRRRQPRRKSVGDRFVDRRNVLLLKPRRRLQERLAARDERDGSQRLEAQVFLARRRPAAEHRRRLDRDQEAGVPGQRSGEPDAGAFARLGLQELAEYRARRIESDRARRCRAGAR